VRRQNQASMNLRCLDLVPFSFVDDQRSHHQII